MIVRRPTEGDSVALASLIRELGWFAWLADEPPDTTEQRVAEHLRACQADDSHSVYVAEHEGQVLGYVSVRWLPYLFLKGKEGYVSELFVLEKARGLGVGSQLLETVTAEARQRGCSRLALITSHKRESYKREFYKKRGWHERDGVASFVFELR